MPENGNGVNGNGKEKVERMWMWVGRVAQILILPLLAFQLSVFSFMAKGERFTRTDAELLHKLEREWVQEEMQGLPPDWLKDDVQELKDDVKANSLAINEVNARLRGIETLLRDR